ncbi:unnamed protein product [Orchesella dallaii]|uniref:EF-hand domain-containing protein n=1 Tax=Orchesella dallaii TaxID=48710 RepID=A0ABP1R5F8_9HEXA
MRATLVCGLLFLFIYGCVAPPVTEQKKKKHDKENAEDNEIEEQAFDVEYKRYLQEVVNVLENDEDFKNRLTKADPEDIKSGNIAKDIEFVNHNVRTKLDELKRQELERLRQIAMRQYEHDNGIDRKHMKIPAHLDPNNPHTFEAEDLRKLIVQTTRDLEDADKKRKEEFKEYEMRKELEYQEQLKHLDEKNRVNAEKHHAQLMEKHKEHKPLHHPGSKPQLEEVWEEQDHLSPEDFNPKTFFHLHDLDGNGHWDANEVKALFRKELDKMYDPNAPEDDMKERFEEMERMREHVFNETDTNKDQMISFQEFLEQTKRQEFEKDEGWEPLDQHPQYSQDEYQQYAKAHEEEIRRMIDQGLMPPPGVHPNAIPHQGQAYHPQDPQHFQAQQQGYHPNQHEQLQYHHGQAPEHHEQQQLHHEQQQAQLHHQQQAQLHHEQQAQLHHQQQQAQHHQAQQYNQQPPQQQVYQQQQPAQITQQQHNQPPPPPQQYNQHVNPPVAAGHAAPAVQQQVHQAPPPVQVQHQVPVQQQQEHQYQPVPPQPPQAAAAAPHISSQVPAQQHHEQVASHH